MTPPPIPSVAQSTSTGPRQAPVLSIIALPAERLPRGGFAAVDCRETMPPEAARHPSVAVMVEEKAGDPSSLAAFVLNGVPQLFDTLREATARIRFLSHARDHGAMLTFGGLEKLVEQLKARGTPASAAVCVPVIAEGVVSMMLCRLGGAHSIRLQAQHVLDGQPIDDNQIRDLVIFDTGVFPPMTITPPQPELATEAGSGSVPLHEEPLPDHPPVQQLKQEHSPSVADAGQGEPPAVPKRRASYKKR